MASNAWSNSQVRDDSAYQEQQWQLQAQKEADYIKQQELNEQRMQAEQKLAQEKLINEQYQLHVQNRILELEQEILNMRGQYNRDQLMLEQYDKVNILFIFNKVI